METVIVIGIVLFLVLSLVGTVQIRLREDRVRREQEEFYRRKNQEARSEEEGRTG